jgi:serine/threonine-protein kinase RsbW
MMVKKQTPGFRRKITIPSSFSKIKYVIRQVSDFLKSLRLDDSTMFDLRLSLEEALINAIKHGNKLDKRLSIDIEFIIELMRDNNKLIVHIEDEGNGFDYQNLPDPTKEENLLKTSGRGVFLIRHLMDEVTFNKKGNRISMVKRLK